MQRKYCRITVWWDSAGLSKIVLVDDQIFGFTKDSKLFIKILLIINRFIRIDTIQSLNGNAFDIVSISNVVFCTGQLNNMLVLFYLNGCVRIVSIKYFPNDPSTDNLNGCEKTESIDVPYFANGAPTVDQR